MEIILCIAVSAITSIAVLKFFAYKYFDVIDKYVQGIMRDTKESINSAINSISDTTRSE